MRNDKLTVKTQEALRAAMNEAIEMGHQEIDASHILYGLLSDDSGTCNMMLKKIGADTRKIRSELNEDLSARPKVTGAVSQPYLSQAANQIMLRAEKETKALKDEYISVEHVLLAITEKPDSNNLISTH